MLFEASDLLTSRCFIIFYIKPYGSLVLVVKVYIVAKKYLFIAFCFVSSETKRYCFGFDMNYLHSRGYCPTRRMLVTTMSTRCTKGKQSCKNMFFKYRKDNRQQDHKLLRFITNVKIVLK